MTKPMALGKKIRRLAACLSVGCGSAAGDPPDCGAFGMGRFAKEQKVGLQERILTISALCKLQQKRFGFETTSDHICVVNPKFILLIVALSVISSWTPAFAQAAVPTHESLAGYEGNLRKVIARLRQTEAIIFWVRTTPWGKDANVLEDASNGDVSIVTTVISDHLSKKERLKVIDADAVMAPMLGSRLKRKDFTHWDLEAYRVLGEAVADAVAPSLKS
jgi:hypothetical protein